MNKTPGLFEVLAALKADDVIERGREAIRKTDLVVACKVATAVVVKMPCTARGGETRCLAVRTEHPDNRSTLGHVLATRSAAAGLDPQQVVRLRVREPAGMLPRPALCPLRVPVLVEQAAPTLSFAVKPEVVVLEVEAVTFPVE